MREHRRNRRQAARGAFWTLLLVWCLAQAAGLLPAVGGSAWAASGGRVSVQAAVEKDTMTMGEPLVLQIRVEGNDELQGADLPDTSGVSDFSVEYLGGQNDSSSTVTIINGKMTKMESYGYVYSYRLTPKRTGTLEVPSIPVPMDAAKTTVLRTQPIAVKVTEPEVTDDFHLELRFSKTSFYLGEPVILTVIWYIGKNPESANFNLPIIQDPAFAVTDPKVEQNPGKQYIQLPIGGANVLAEKGTGVYHGRQYTTLSFRKVIFARQAGRIEIPEATVSSRALVGYSRDQRGRSPFDSSFDDRLFNPGGRGVYKTFVARSPLVVLTVRPLPEEGRPADFSGCVGHYRLEATATPVEVSVGDPITLTVSISGPEYLDNVELPPLAKDPELGKDFKVPEEMAAGVVKENAKQFTQTLRAKSADVTSIPPIRLTSFNPDTGRYEVAQSQPLPLKVKPAKVLTSADVEGRPEEVGVRKSELEDWSKGIAYNYEGPEVIEREVYRVAAIVGSPAWLAATLAPMGVFAVLLVFTQVRRKRLADPDRLRSRKAVARFKSRVKAVRTAGGRGVEGCALLLDAVRDYLAEKLGHHGAALTFADVVARLSERGISQELSERLRCLFEACERGSYGGMDLGQGIDALTEDALDIARSLEKVL